MAYNSDVTIKYKGRERSTNNNLINTVITYQGSYELLLDKQENLKIGTSGDEGTIESTRLFCDDGPIWNLEVRYALDNNVEITDTGTSYGPTRSELETSLISRPIESLKKWKRKWSYNLYYASSGTHPATVPEWWNTDDINHDTPLDNPTTYGSWGWGKTISDLDNAPDGKKWIKAKNMTKPRSGDCGPIHILT